MQTTYVCLLPPLQNRLDVLRRRVCVLTPKLPPKTRRHTHTHLHLHLPRPLTHLTHAEYRPACLVSRSSTNPHVFLHRRLRRHQQQQQQQQPSRCAIARCSRHSNGGRHAATSSRDGFDDALPPADPRPASALSARPRTEPDASGTRQEDTEAREGRRQGGDDDDDDDFDFDRDTLVGIWAGEDKDASCIEHAPATVAARVGAEISGGKCSHATSQERQSGGGKVGACARWRLCGSRGTPICRRQCWEQWAHLPEVRHVLRAPWIQHSLGHLAVAPETGISTRPAQC